MEVMPGQGRLRQVGIKPLTGIQAWQRQGEIPIAIQLRPYRSWVHGLGCSFSQPRAVQHGHY